MDAPSQTFFDLVVRSIAINCYPGDMHVVLIRSQNPQKNSAVDAGFGTLVPGWFHA